MLLAGCAPFCSAKASWRHGQAGCPCLVPATGARRKGVAHRSALIPRRYSTLSLSQPSRRRNATASATKLPIEQRTAVALRLLPRVSKSARAVMKCHVARMVYGRPPAHPREVGFPPIEVSRRRPRVQLQCSRRRATSALRVRSLRPEKRIDIKLSSPIRHGERRFTSIKPSRFRRASSAIRMAT